VVRARLEDDREALARVVGPDDLDVQVEEAVRLLRVRNREVEDVAHDPIRGIGRLREPGDRRVVDRLEAVGRDGGRLEGDKCGEETDDEKSPPRVPTQGQTVSHFPPHFSWAIEARSHWEAARAARRIAPLAGARAGRHEPGLDVIQG
jgi:hypothetical protein